MPKNFRHDGKPSDSYDENIAKNIGRKRINRYAREDVAERETLKMLEGTDPVLTSEQISEITGWSKRSVDKILSDFNIGAVVDDRGRRLVRMSELKEMLEDFRRHREGWG